MKKCKNLKDFIVELNSANACLSSKKLQKEINQSEFKNEFEKIMLFGLSVREAKWFILNDNSYEDVFCHLGNKKKLHGSKFLTFCGNKGSCQCNLDNFNQKQRIKTHLKQKEINNKRRKTNLAKYGTEFASQTELVKEKARNTCLKKYGAKSYTSNDENLKKIKASNLSSLGVDWPMQDSTIEKKRQETCLKLYQSKSPLTSPGISAKIKESNLEKYGVEYPFQSEEIRNKGVETLKDRYGVENGRHTINAENYNKLSKDFLEKELETKSILTIANEMNIHYQTIARYCKKFHINYETQKTSDFERQICELLNENNIKYETNNRKIIKPYEIDVLIESLKLGFELNGSFWHSEKNGFDKNRHLNKTILTQQQGYSLIHIWEHEWKFQKEKIAGLIRTKLSLNTLLYARKCQVVEVDNKSYINFCNQNHLQGSSGASIKLGLKYNDELVAIMSFGKSRFSKKHQWELIRVCTKTDFNIIGGANRMFNHFLKKHRPTSVISYCDKSKFSGKVYEKLGFVLSHSSDPSYFYTKDYLNFENRQTFQKHKLKNKLDVFDPKLTEWENMQINGYDRIWDCGNDVWVWIS